MGYFHPDIEAFLAVVITASGARGKLKKQLTQELESHIFESIERMKRENIPEEKHVEMLKKQFGDPENIGEGLNVVHQVSLQRNIWKVFAGFGVLIVAIIFFGMFFGDHYEKSATAYQHWKAQEYVDTEWLTEAQRASIIAEFGADSPELTCQEDGIGVTWFVLGDIVSDCYTSWIVFLGSDPVQIDGPRISPQELEQFIKDHDALFPDGTFKHVTVVFGTDDIETFSMWALKDFLSNLEIGSGFSESERAQAFYIKEEKRSAVLRNEIIPRESFFDAAGEIWDGEELIDAQDFGEMFKKLCKEGEVMLASCYPVRNDEDYTFLSRHYVEQGSTTAFAYITARHEVMQKDGSVIFEDVGYKLMRADGGVVGDWTDDAWHVVEILSVDEIERESAVFPGKDMVIYHEEKTARVSWEPEGYVFYVDMHDGRGERRIAQQHVGEGSGEVLLESIVLQGDTLTFRESGIACTKEVCEGLDDFSNEIREYRVNIFTKEEAVRVVVE